MLKHNRLEIAGLHVLEIVQMRAAFQAIGAAIELDTRESAAS